MINSTSIALSRFVRTNRKEIVSRAHEGSRQRSAPQSPAPELLSEVGHFIDQLGDALECTERGEPINDREARRSAKEHGANLLRESVPLTRVVHNYGDICQIITQLAVEREVAISTGSFHALNKYLDNAIAEAAGEYLRHREKALTDEGTERLGILAHEMRNLLGLATMALEHIKGEMPAFASGYGGAICTRSLLALADLIDRSLAGVRLETGKRHVEKIAVTEFLDELAVEGTIYAGSKEQKFAVQDADPSLLIEGDRQILAAAIRNLLHNAFKFTPRLGTVSLSTRVRDSRIFFDVGDQCGGLPAGTAENLFQAYEQRGPDRSGVGLGLVMCRRAATANHGDISVGDIPGYGCVFTIDLPLYRDSVLDSDAVDAIGMD